MLEYLQSTARASVKLVNIIGLNPLFLWIVAGQMMTNHGRTWNGVAPQSQTMLFHVLRKVKEPKNVCVCMCLVQSSQRYDFPSLPTYMEFANNKMRVSILQMPCRLAN